MNLALPCLLDGATGTNLFRSTVPQDLCPELLLLKNPQQLLTLQKAYVEAGSQVLYTPTLTTNEGALEKWGLSERMAELNQKLCRLTVEASGKDTIVAGCLSSAGKVPEPHGPVPYTELIEIYRRQAQALKEGGAHCLIIETMIYLPEARAAVLGARETGLPIWVTFTPENKAHPLEEMELLACLVTLQGLGIEAFGLNCSAGPMGMEQLLRFLLPYATVPLIAKPAASFPTPSGKVSLSPNAFAAAVCQLVEAGASMVGGCCGSTPDHIQVLAQMLPQCKIPSPYKEDPTLLLAGEGGAYFLEEDFSLSEEIACHVDMADEILAMEETGCDALHIRVKNADEGVYLGQNAYLCRLPLHLLADNAAALESALLHCSGKVLVDARSDLAPEELAQLAARYGAVVR